MKNCILTLLALLLWATSCAPEHHNQYAYIFMAKRITDCKPGKPYRILVLDDHLMYPGKTTYPMITDICSQKGFERLSAPQEVIDSYKILLILCKDNVSTRDSLTVEITIEQKLSRGKLALFNVTLVRGDTLVLQGNF